MWIDITKLDSTYRGIKRYREIVSIIIKLGFDDLISTAKLQKYVNFGQKFLPGKRDPKAETFTRWERIRIAIEELGPTFIKFGQIMSNRPDLLPKDLITELVKLQDSVKSFPSEDARKIVEEELETPINEVFEYFEDEPLNCASIAQVHKAKLKTGEEVAVKIQKPSIDKTVQVDLEIMSHLAAFIEKHVEGAHAIDITGIVEEFDKKIKEELDFTFEAAHYERLRRNFKDDNSIYVPRIFAQYTTRKLLLVEFISGVKISEIMGEKGRDLDSKLIAKHGATLILKQIFEHGYFHADPHPGNILIMENNVICFLDLGQVGSITPRHREDLSSIIIGIITGNSSKVVHAIAQLSETPPMETIDQLENEVDEFVGRYSYIPLKDVNIVSLLDEIVKILSGHNLKLNPVMFLLLKAFVTLEGTGKKLDPEFNLVEHAEPFAMRLLKNKMSPKEIVKDIFNIASDFRSLLKNLPTDIRDILKMVKSGQTKVNYQVKGLEPMLNKHDQISTRIVFAIVLGSLIVGSSLIVHSKIPPMWFGVSVIGIAGFLAAGFIGFWLIISILRKGKM